MDLKTEAIEIVLESYHVEQIKDFGDYYTHINIEVLGYFFPVFRSRKFWLRCVKLLYLHVNVQESIDLMVEKNRMYGSKQLYLMNTLGILIRSIDKIERIKNIDKGVKSDLLLKESRKDNLTDLFNYAILAVLVIDRKL